MSMSANVLKTEPFNFTHFPFFQIFDISIPRKKTGEEKKKKETNTNDRYYY